MKYQEIKNLLGDTTNEPSQFRIREIYNIIDDSREIYNVNSDIKFKISKIRLNLCD